MAVVRPFRGLLYDPKRYADASGVIAPPYDVIDEAYRRELLERDPHNVVRLILGEDREGDDDGNDKYTRAAADLAAWREDGTLVRDDAPSLYLYRQTYRVPGESADRHRDGVLGAVRLEDPDSGVVRPHERTLEGPKADRLKLTRATGANLSPVFGLFSDPEGRVLLALRETTLGPPLLDGTDRDGIRHRLWRLRRERELDGFAAALADREIFIADGHHRYATALNHRALAREAHPDAGPDATFEHVLMFLCPMEDDGMVVLPIHRVLHSLPGFDPDAFLARMRERVPIREVESVAAAQAAVADPDATGRPLGLMLRGHDAAYVADLEGVEGGETPTDVPAVLWDLDVRRLQRWVIEEAAGVTPEQQARKEHMGFYSKADVAEDLVRRGEADVALFLRSTPIEQVREVARAGETMPQKSTYFYPKLATGMVLNPLLPPETL